MVSTVAMRQDTACFHLTHAVCTQLIDGVYRGKMASDETRTKMVPPQEPLPLVDYLFQHLTGVWLWDVELEMWGGACGCGYGAFWFAASHHKHGQDLQACSFMQFIQSSKT